MSFLHPQCCHEVDLGEEEQGEEEQGEEEQGKRNRGRKNRGRKNRGRESRGWRGKGKLVRLCTSVKTHTCSFSSDRPLSHSILN